MSLGRDTGWALELGVSVQAPPIIVSNECGESKLVQNIIFDFKWPDIHWEKINPGLQSEVRRYLVFLSDTMKSFSKNLEIKSPEHLELAIAVMDELTERVMREIEKLVNEKHSPRTIDSNQFSLRAYQKNGMFGYSFTEINSTAPALSPGQR